MTTIDPIEYIQNRLAPNGRCLFMPNGGNLGDNLIASATLQRFTRASIPWAFIRNERKSVKDSDILVFGGGGSLTSLYRGGIECVESLIKLGSPVVVLPQSINGHFEFWKNAPQMTVFCRDRPSFNYMKGFTNIQAYPAEDMAIDLDLSVDPFATIMAIREATLEQAEHRILHAFRCDQESLGQVYKDSFDVPAIIYPPLSSIESIHANSCAFLATLATYSEIWTDRLHVAIAGGLIGIRTYLSDNSYGKNRAVYEFSLRSRFKHISFI